MTYAIPVIDLEDVALEAVRAGTEELAGREPGATGDGAGVHGGVPGPGGADARAVRASSGAG